MNSTIIRDSDAGVVKLARMTLGELRNRYRHELFDVILPFWDSHGADHENGGVMHGLDCDGRLVDSDKLL